MSAVPNAGLLDALALRWGALASRERALVGGAAALIVAALLWGIAISPALTGLRQASQAAPQLEAQLQLMRAQASQAASLKAQRLLSYDESLRSLEAAVQSLGAGATLSVSDARASIMLRGISGDALTQMLAQVRANARLVPSELRIKQSTTPAAGAAPAWDGTMVLNLPAR